MLEPQNILVAGKNAGSVGLQPQRKSRLKLRAGWINFEKQFLVRNPHFLHDIAKAFPAMTRTELEICAMLRESLVSWQIAELLATTERTIENHRSNIRRKLSLLPNQNLQMYLIGF